jgi:hypothetical protein
LIPVRAVPLKMHRLGKQRQGANHLDVVADFHRKGTCFTVTGDCDFASTVTVSTLVGSLRFLGMKSLWYRRIANKMSYQLATFYYLS